MQNGQGSGASRARAVNPVDNSHGVKEEPRSMTSTTLVTDAKADCPRAWERLVGSYSPRIRRWCRSAGLNEHDAFDVLQNVLLALHRNLHAFSREGGVGSFRRWLRTITNSKLHDFWRRQGRHPGPGGTTWHQVLQQIAEPDDSADSSIGELARSDDRRCRALAEVRSESSKRDWMIFEQIVLEEHSAKDVAEKLNVSENTVYLVKSRLIKKVRERHHKLESSSDDASVER